MVRQGLYKIWVLFAEYLLHDGNSCEVLYTRISSDLQNSPRRCGCAHHVVEDARGRESLGDRIPQPSGEHLDLDSALSDSKFHGLAPVLPPRATADHKIVSRSSK